MEYGRNSDIKIHPDARQEVFGNPCMACGMSHGGCSRNKSVRGCADSHGLREIPKFKIRTQFELRPYFGFLGFPGPTGVDPKSYGSKLVRIDELRHGEFIWDPHRACRRRWDHFSQNTDAIRIASVFWILGFPGAHGCRPEVVPVEIDQNR